MNKRIIFLLPIPPPYSGTEIFNELILQQLKISLPSIIHIVANIRNTNKERSKINYEGIYSFLIIIKKIIEVIISNNVKVLYYVLSASHIGFIKDSFYVIIAKLFGLNVIGHFHGTHFVHLYNDSNYLFKIYLKYILNLNDRIIVLGYTQKVIFENYIPAEKIKVLYNGIKIDNIINHFKKDVNSVFTILFIGHLWFPKGFYDLILAYKILHNKHKNKISLIFAGERIRNDNFALDFLENPWKKRFLKSRKSISSEIDEFIDNSSLYNAKYLGVISGLSKRNAFLQTDLFVLPSYSEGFSMSCLEAMSYSLPILTTPVGVNPEILIEGDNCFYVPVGDVNLMIHKIELAMNNRDALNIMGNNNKVKVNNLFSIERTSTKLLEILSEF